MEMGQLYGKQMKSGFKNTLTKSISGSASNFLNFRDFSYLAGAVLVLQGKLIIGQLMFLDFVWIRNRSNLKVNNYVINQETVYFERISDIIDNPQEIEIIGKDLPPMPPINGKVTFENVNFKFSDTSKLILKNINFKSHQKFYWCCG